ncbi:MAG: FAD-binding oxidoreductase [Gammaproteobacteria bacterium]|nr:MAG: FAD-binding oxidoreductase [Gammaproteobacteria bacterium]
MPMRRRTFVTGLAIGAGTTLLPAGLIGCADGAPYVVGDFRTPSGAPLLPVQVSEDRIIRTVVGLRPFRPAGFRVEAERLDDKLLVHNYGHGGGGWTLSWGTAALAAELALASDHRRAAVIGCGIVGLTTARTLQRRGFEVTVYARELPPDTTSNIAGAQWSPASVFDPDVATPAFHHQLDRALRIAYRAFQEQVGERYGVRWISNYWLRDDPPRLDTDLRTRWRDLYPEQRDLTPEEHPFAAAYVQHVSTLFMEPPRYLPAIMEDVRLAGGRIEVRSLDSPEAVAQLPDPVVVNCTGLGAGVLFGDSDIFPIKGQLTVLRPQPGVDYLVINDAGLYMFPRHDGILLGGTNVRRDWSLIADETAEARIVAGHEALFAAMSAKRKQRAVVAEPQGPSATAHTG